MIAAKLLTDEEGEVLLLCLTHDDLAAVCSDEVLHFDTATFALPSVRILLLAAPTDEDIKRRVLAAAAMGDGLANDIANPRSE